MYGTPYVIRIVIYAVGWQLVYSTRETALSMLCVVRVSGGGVMKPSWSGLQQGGTVQGRVDTHWLRRKGQE